jgi:protein-S-isoprenylcysteine O-methyltransferase Ste14
VACYALAHLLYWSALRAHGRDRPAFAFLPAAPAALKTAGPYRFVRHPIYAAYLLAWLAGVLVTGQAWLLAAPALMGAFYRRAALDEERSLLSGPLGAEYLAYRGRTGMFLPRLRDRAAL